MTHQLETRSFEVRSVDLEKREIRGIAVPWGEVAEIGGFYRERFERGSLELAPAGVKLYAVHGHRGGALPIGNVSAVRDTERGAEIVARVSKTERGDETLVLADDRALGHLSIGFEPLEGGHRIDRDADGNEVVTRTRAVLKEVSVVPFPAYAGATITEVREAAGHPEQTTEGGDMPEQQNRDQAGAEQYATGEDVEAVRSEITELGRRLDTMGEQHRGGSAGSRFRTAGQLLKALAAGDEQARTELRAADAVGPATSDQAGASFGGAGWINRPLRFMLDRRRIVNVFDHAPLPDQGNSVEYPKVASTSGTVEQQAAEGTALAYMEVELDTGTALVGTYGGYSQLSRQAIERGDAAYLDGVFRYQAIQYAKATNVAARNAFLAIVSPNPLVLTGGHAAAKAADWISVVVDAAAAIEDDSLGLLADVIVVGRDVFKSIAGLVDASERPIFALPNGGQAVNAVGSAGPVTAQFNIAGLPGFVDPGVPANTCRVASRDALTTLESSGAPFRLQDESIVNLTRDFSLYGYAAWTENDAAGVVTVDVDGI